MYPSIINIYYLSPPVKDHEIKQSIKIHLEKVACLKFYKVAQKSFEESAQGKPKS